MQVNQKRLEKGLVGLIDPVFQSLAGELASLGNVDAKDIFKTVKDGKKRTVSRSSRKPMAPVAGPFSCSPYRFPARLKDKRLF